MIEKVEELKPDSKVDYFRRAAEYAIECILLYLCILGTGVYLTFNDNSNLGVFLLLTPWAACQASKWVVRVAGDVEKEE